MAGGGEGIQIIWVTFDCYGTLIDWDFGIRQALRAIFGRRLTGVEEGVLFSHWEAIQYELIQKDYQPYREILAQSLGRALGDFGISVEPGEGARFAASMPTWPPFPDTKPALDALRGRVKLAIISNVDDDILAQSVRLMDVAFDALITAQQAKAYKPHLRPFELALSRLGCSPQDILHVAFGFQYDISPAQRLGLRTCWVNRSGGPRPGPIQPDYEVRDLRGLVSIVSHNPGR